MISHIFHRKDNRVLGADELRPLVERYLDGDTTNEEEERLRQHFTCAEADIPADLHYLKALFAYEATNRAAGKVEKETHQKVATRRIVAWTAVAAAVATVFLVTMPRHDRADNYVLIDGQRYVQSEMVMQEAEATLDMVAYTNDAFSALDMMSTDGETSR